MTYIPKVSPLALVELSYQAKVKRSGWRSSPALEEIFTEIVQLFGANPIKVKNAARKTSEVMLRRLFTYVAVTLTKKSLLEISNFIGRKEHSNSIRYLKTAKNFFDTNDPLWMEVWEHYIENSIIWKQYNSGN